LNTRKTRGYSNRLNAFGLTTEVGVGVVTFKDQFEASTTWKVV
jgi:hypothetical protein